MSRLDRLLAHSGLGVGETVLPYLHAEDAQALRATNKLHKEASKNRDYSYKTHYPLILQDKSRTWDVSDYEDELMSIFSDIAPEIEQWFEECEEEGQDPYIRVVFYSIIERVDVEFMNSSISDKTLRGESKIRQLLKLAPDYDEEDEGALKFHFPLPKLVKQQRSELTPDQYAERYELEPVSREQYLRQLKQELEEDAKDKAERKRRGLPIDEDTPYEYIPEKDITEATEIEYIPDEDITEATEMGDGFPRNPVRQPFYSGSGRYERPIAHGRDIFAPLQDWERERYSFNKDIHGNVVGGSWDQAPHPIADPRDQGMWNGWHPIIGAGVATPQFDDTQDDPEPEQKATHVPPQSLADYQEPLVIPSSTTKLNNLQRFRGRSFLTSYQ